MDSEKNLRDSLQHTTDLLEKLTPLVERIDERLSTVERAVQGNGQKPLESRLTTLEDFRTFAIRKFDRLTGWVDDHGSLKEQGMTTRAQFGFWGTVVAALIAAGAAVIASRGGP